MPDAAIRSLPLVPATEWMRAMPPAMRFILHGDIEKIRFDRQRGIALGHQRIGQSGQQRRLPRARRTKNHGGAVLAISDALKKLLEAREQLANLITYMDGKTGAEELVSKLLRDPALLQTLATTKNPQDEPSS